MTPLQGPSWKGGEGKQTKVLLDPHPGEMQSRRFCLVPHPQEAEPKDSRAGHPCPYLRESSALGLEREGKLRAKLTSFEVPNPHKRTRNSLRISEVEASAKCNRAGNGETCQLGQHLGRGMWSGPLAKRGRNAAGLPNRELEACAGSHQPATGHAGKGARRRGRLRAHPELQACFPSLWPPLTPGHPSESQEPPQPCSVPRIQPHHWSEPWWLKGSSPPVPSHLQTSLAGLWLPHPLERHPLSLSVQHLVTTDYHVPTGAPWGVPFSGGARAHLPPQTWTSQREKERGLYSGGESGGTRQKLPAKSQSGSRSP